MKAMLVDTNWCFGCHACEVMTQMEQGLPPEQTGLKVVEVGLWPYTNDEGEEKWQDDFLPIPTDQFKYLAKDGEQPDCATICQGKCLKFGELEDMVKELDHSKQVLFVL